MEDGLLMGGILWQKYEFPTFGGTQGAADERGGVDSLFACVYVRMYACRLGLRLLVRVRRKDSTGVGIGIGVRINMAVKVREHTYPPHTRAARSCPQRDCNRKLA